MLWSIQCYGVPVTYILRYFRIVFYTVGFLTPLVIWCLFDRSGTPTVRVARRWARAVLRTSGIHVEVVGLESLDLDSPGIVMSNHCSVVDIPVLAAALPTPFRFVAKKELTWIPIFGWALALSDQIVVDRKRHLNALRALEEGAAKVHGGTKVLVFPEGTRSSGDDLLPFKAGCFHLAIAKGWPVIPVGILGAEAITPKGSLRVEPGTVRVVLGKAVPTAGREGLKARQLMAEVRTEIQTLLAPKA